MVELWLFTFYPYQPILNNNFLCNMLNKSNVCLQHVWLKWMKDLVSEETMVWCRCESETWKTGNKEFQKGQITTIKLLLTFPALTHHQSKVQMAKYQNISLAIVVQRQFDLNTNSFDTNILRLKSLFIHTCKQQRMSLATAGLYNGLSL